LSIKKQTPHAVTCGIVKNYFLSAVAAEPTVPTAALPAAPDTVDVTAAVEALEAAGAAEVLPPTDGTATALCGATGAATVGEVCVVIAGTDTSTTGVVVEVEPAAGLLVLLVQPTNIAAATAVITSVFILFSFILEFGLQDRTSSTALRQNRYLS
jgi:hypothetical protein